MFIEAVFTPVCRPTPSRQARLEALKKKRSQLDFSSPSSAGREGSLLSPAVSQPLGGSAGGGSPRERGT